MTTTGTLIILFCIATSVAVAVRRLQIPYTVALVIVGLALGSLHLVDPPELTRDLLFAVFLPGLLFEAAFHLDAIIFRRLWLAIAGLAIPGVIVAIVVTALLVVAGFRLAGLAPSLAWGTALVFSAVVAATDPVAVTALFRRLDVPDDLLVLIEGESLLNDGTSIVLLALILSQIASGSIDPVGVTTSFIVITGGGALVGLVVGLVVTRVISRVDESVLEITLTTIAAYGSFALAEKLHVSGVIATVAAGMVCGSRHGRSAISETSHAAVESFWDYVAFALNSVVFLLIGLEVSLGSLGRFWREIAIAYAAVLAARALVVLGGRMGWTLLRRTRPSVAPLPWSVILVWGGLRGALSMVLALALAPNVADRDLVITLTTGVVLLTLLVQGLTMAPLLRHLKIGRESS